MYAPNNTAEKIYENKIDRTERISRHSNNYSWKFQHPSLNAVRTIRQKIERIEKFKSSID